jgi:hypothetical protein
MVSYINNESFLCHLSSIINFNYFNRCSRHNNHSRSLGVKDVEDDDGGGGEPRVEALISSIRAYNDK